MAVIVDATGTKLITTVAGTTVNYTGITVGTGVDRALVVTVACAAAVTAPNAHWDTAGANQAMTLITTVKTQTNVTTFMFGLRNPVAGAKTLNVAWTTSSVSNIEAISFTDVDQTSDAKAFINANFVSDGGTVSSILMGLSSPAGSIAVASYGTSATFSSLTGTNLFTDTTNTGCEGAASRSAGAGATINFTGADTSTAGNKVMVGFVVAPVITVSPPPLSDPVRPKIAGLAIAIMASGLFSGPLPPTEDIAKVDRWYTSWQDPVWPKKGLAAHEQQFFASPGLTKEDIPRLKWTVLWQDPVRVRPALGIQHQPASAFLPLVPTAATIQDWPDFAKAKPRAIEVQPLPFGPFPIAATTPTGWNDPLEGPVRNWQRSSIYSAPFLAFTALAREDIPVQEWTVLWQDPVRIKLGLGVQHQPSLAWSTFTPAAVPTGWNDPLEVPVRNWQRSPIYTAPFLAYAPFVTVPAPTMAWVRWPDFAPKARPSTDPQSFAFVPLVPTATVIADWPDFARRKQPPLDTQLFSWSSNQFVPTMAWANWPDFAERRQQPSTDPQSFVFTPEPSYETVVYDWPDFATRKPQLPDTQPLIWAPRTIAPVVVPTMAWVRWPDFAPAARRAVEFQPFEFVAIPPSGTVIADWPDFATRKPQPLDVQSLPWSTFTPAAAAPVVLVPDRWPDFATKKRPLNYDPLAFLQTVTSPFNSFVNWPDFAPRKKPAADFVPWTFIPTPRQVFFPYGPWDDFARRKRPLNYDPLAFLQTVRTPWVTMTTWPDFATKPGLRAHLQKFTERDLFVAFVPIIYLASLNATEQGDFLTAVLSQFNTPISAYVDIVQNDPRQRGNLGVIENVAQSSIIASIAEPQTVPATGQPVSTVAGARVAIIIQGAGP